MLCATPQQNTNTVPRLCYISSNACTLGGYPSAGIVKCNLLFSVLLFLLSSASSVRHAESCPCEPYSINPYTGQTLYRDNRKRRPVKFQHGISDLCDVNHSRVKGAVGLYMLAMTPQSVLYCFFALQWENKGEETKKRKRRRMNTHLVDRRPT